MLAVELERGLGARESGTHRRAITVEVVQHVERGDLDTAPDRAGWGVGRGSGERDRTTGCRRYVPKPWCTMAVRSAIVEPVRSIRGRQARCRVARRIGVLRCVRVVEDDPRTRVQVRDRKRVPNRRLCVGSLILAASS